MGPDGGCPAGVTWSGYTRCHPWWRCWTMARSCRAGCGPGGRSCAGWSRGSGSLARSPGAGCSPCGSVKEDGLTPCAPAPLVALSAGPHGNLQGCMQTAPFWKETKSLLSLCTVLESLDSWRGSTAQRNKGWHWVREHLLGEQTSGTWRGMGRQGESSPPYSGIRTAGPCDKEGVTVPSSQTPTRGPSSHALGVCRPLGHASPLFTSG